ncbi:MAG: hypothetical protein WD492_12800 [Alkalispirochaeta sp.]
MDKYKGHSPAPWKPTEEDVACTSIVDADGKLVVAGEWDGWMAPFPCAEERAEANMRLILDAPKILAENLQLRKALRWYEEQARGCRLIGTSGDVYRHALDSDGGERARAALKGDSDAGT